MQFDFSKLLGRIKELGYTQESLAKEIGISEVTMSLKLNNKAFFTQPEMEKIRRTLLIPRDEMGAYFFTLKVQETKL